MSRDATQIRDNVIAAAEAFIGAYEKHMGEEYDLINSTEASREDASKKLLLAQSHLMSEIAGDAAALPYFQRGLVEAINAIKADRIG